MTTRLFTAACAAAAIGLAMPLAAQSGHPAAETGQKLMTITGCLQKTKSGGFWLTTTAAAGQNEAANPSGQAAAPTGTSGSAVTKSTTWNLEGSDDLDEYVGHKIQVTGEPENETSGDQLKGTTGDREMHARDIDVKSVKVISGSCS